MTAHDAVLVPADELERLRLFACRYLEMREAMRAEDCAFPIHGDENIGQCLDNGNCGCYWSGRLGVDHSGWADDMTILDAELAKEAK